MPLVWGGDQSALSRVSAHVIQLLQLLLVAPNIRVVETPLLDAVRAVEVHRGRRVRRLHLAAPENAAALPEVLEGE
jgi:hypothetical protein